MKKFTPLFLLILILLAIFVSTITLFKKYNTLNSQASISQSPLIQIQEINTKLLSGINAPKQDLLKRKEILTQELETNPSLFWSHLLPEKIITQLGQKILTENYVDIKQGNIFTVISEDFKNKPIINNYLQLPNKKLYQIILPQSKKQTFSNQKTTFKKKLVLFNEKIITDEKNIILQQTEPPTLTNQSVAIIPVTFTKNKSIDAETKNTLKSKILDLKNTYSVNAYYKTITKDKFFFNTETSVISEWISLYNETKEKINSDGSNFCEFFRDFKNDYRYNTTNMQVVLDKFYKSTNKKFNHYIYVIDNSFDPQDNKNGRISCSGGIVGLANYGGNETFIFENINDILFSQIIIHEIGHNLNLNHAGAGQFINGSYQIFQYADSFNPMGKGYIANQLRQSNLYGYFSGLHQIGLNMNLLDFNKQIVEIKSSIKTVKINFLNSNLEGKKMVRVIQDNQLSDEEIGLFSFTDNGFFIECQKYNKYNQFPQFKNQSGIALIRKNYYSFYWGDPPFTILMDAHPQTPTDFSDAYLTADSNDYYFDPTSNILVKLESVDLSGCNFSIKYNAKKPSTDPKLPYLEPIITPSPWPTITLTPIMTPTPIPICASKYPCPSGWSCNGNKVPGTQGSFTLHYCTKNP